MAVVTHSGARKNDGEIMEWKEEKQLIKNIQPNCVFKALITKIQRGVQMDSLFIQKSTGRGRKFSQEGEEILTGVVGKGRVVQNTHGPPIVCSTQSS